jgi:hypothetical protein
MTGPRTPGASKSCASKRPERKKGSDPRFREPPRAHGCPGRPVAEPEREGWSARRFRRARGPRAAPRSAPPAAHALDLDPRPPDPERLAGAAGGVSCLSCLSCLLRPEARQAMMSY